MKTGTIEDYLKQIYKLELSGRRVSTSALAATLDIADPSVTDMLKKLSGKGLLSYRPYKGVQLTKNGREMAARILRRHRLWEVYLMKRLGYTWDRVHEEAERLEHATSDMLADALAKALGEPEFDPHGDPIPSPSGELRQHDHMPLANVEAGRTVRVTRVTDTDPAFLQHLSRLGIVMRTAVTVRERMGFDGSLHIEVKGNEHFVSAVIAQNVFVNRYERRRKR